MIDTIKKSSLLICISENQEILNKNEKAVKIHAKV